MEKQDYRLAVLKDRNRDLSKRWFVEFYAYNEDTGKLQRYPIYLPAKYKTDTERRKYAKELIHDINAKLTQGYVMNAADKTDKQKVETKETIQQKTLLITAFYEAVAVLKVARKAGKVRQLRGLLSVKDFAEKLEVSSGTISNIETGTRKLSINMARRIAELYNVSVDWLYEGGEEKMKEEKGNTVPNILAHSNEYIYLLEKHIKALEEINHLKEYLNTLPVQKSGDKLYNDD